MKNSDIDVSNLNKIILFFKNVQKLQIRNKKVLTGFEVMDEQGNIYLPKAEINKNTVILSLISKNKIRKVLYGYKPFTRANLENEAGLPASSFSISPHRKP